MSHKRKPNKPYLPLLETIRRKCAEIQSTWTRFTEKKRRGATEEWEVPDAKKVHDGMLRRDKWDGRDE